MVPPPYSVYLLLPYFAFPACISCKMDKILSTYCQQVGSVPAGHLLHPPKPGQLPLGVAAGILLEVCDHFRQGPFAFR